MTRRLFIAGLSAVLVPLGAAAAPVPFARRTEFEKVVPGTRFRDRYNKTWVKFSGPDRPPGAFNATGIEDQCLYTVRAFAATEIVYP